MINSGEGGFLCTDDEEIAAKAICYAGCYEGLVAQHVVAPPTEVFDRVKKQTPNYSLRMSDLTACCVRPQLENLEERIAKYNRRYVGAPACPASTPCRPLASIPLPMRASARARAPSHITSRPPPAHLPPTFILSATT